MESLKRLRLEIDEIDKEMFRLLKRRFTLVRKVGKFKVKWNIPIYQRGRWLKMLELHVSRGKKMNLDQGFVESLMKLIHKESIGIQKRMKKEVSS